MFAKLFSLGVTALEGFAVVVETDVSGGLPQFAIVGLPDSAVKEATDRVRSALKNLGFTYPPSRVTVNLAPADVKKTGPVYDLPVLLGLLSASGQMETPPEHCAFIGELSLDGGVRPVSGVLPMALACRKAGVEHLFLPLENAREAALAEGLCVYPVRNAKEIVEHFSGGERLQAAQPGRLALAAGGCAFDFADVHGQPEARRAAEIAAAGMHNMIFVGAPGSGKSMIAKRMPGILPAMTRAEAIETSKIYSVAGLLSARDGEFVVTQRPFRAPHHSVSAAALAGGGPVPKPGEISLSHNGVLFLDELPEFPRDALEVLRQPMEDGHVNVSRVKGSASFPSQFLLVAAMNPCPCGYFGHPVKECRCTQGAIEKYLSRVSGPLLDRMDLHVEVQPVEYADLAAPEGGEASADILRRVQKARKFARGRNGGTDAPPNARLFGDELRRQSPLTGGAAKLLETAFAKMGLSARGYDRVLRVSRTIADLDGAEMIDTPHVAEAVQYRNLDRKYWYAR